ncbi:hypothetical protein E3T54_15480 [Cryobacterium sp. Sr8]|uniref:hypothetical protein n=1 Tax=Cryobacterium sp. Sr8 TaxID=1259203 RepID=UPI00106DBD87|nr:hypothetical protein [Cryobacterium sp. Sr8]TFD74188.1 hypothetical protein E3T54_15480 [Cryobacterium sp. Sr8]
MALRLEDARYGAERSRRLLITTIVALGEHANAMTVVGAHAVHVWVQKKWGPVDMESTRDGDLAVNPVLIAEDPKIMQIMAEIGLEPARPERPGIYGYVNERGLSWEQRTTVDLLVPETYAGSKGRSARIPGQKSATTRAYGLELAIHDRTLIRISTTDGEPEMSVEVNVAGPAALLIAKAHKVSERLADVDKRPDRLRPKDSGDIALLMMVTDGAEMAKTMTRHVAETPEIRGVVQDGAQYLVDMYSTDNDTIVREHMADSLSARFPESTVFNAVDAWLASFSANFPESGD